MRSRPPSLFLHLRSLPVPVPASRRRAERGGRVSYYGRRCGVRVCVFTPELDSPAARALGMEGLEVEEIALRGENGYGEAFSAAWNLGQPFMACEWDVIPWPGAVEALGSCAGAWCTHRYPVHAKRLTTSFGIGCYRPVGPAPPEWSETPWRLLDGQVIPHLRKTLGPPCVHEPPVAHARIVK